MGANQFRDHGCPPVRDAGRVYKGGGDGSRYGKRWWRELTDHDDRLHVEVQGIRKARCQE